MWEKIMGTKTKKQEKNYYQPVLNALQALLRKRASDFHLEITAEGFSAKLKAEVKENIIWYFLQERKARPDITGFIKGDYSSDFIAVEVKRDKISLEDIYQTKKYADLFDAKLPFLVSLQPIPGNIKRLHKKREALLTFPLNWRRTLVLAHFDENSNAFSEWYPEDPFEKDSLWD